MEALHRWCEDGGGNSIFDKPAPVTQLSFGDELSHPITVLAADFDACILPDQLTDTVMLRADDEGMGGSLSDSPPHAAARQGAATARAVHLAREARLSL